MKYEVKGKQVIPQTSFSVPNMEKIYVSISEKYNLPPLIYPIEIRMADIYLRVLGFTLI